MTGVNLNLRDVLRLLIDRIAPEVGGISLRALWESDLADGEQIARAGKLHLAEALSEAREALASDDEDRIKNAVALCPGLERTGRKLAEQNRAASLRSAGGKRCGEQQSRESTKVWAQWMQRYEELKSRGVDYRKARRSVKKSMTDESFVLGGRFPTDKTIATWLPKY